MVQILPRVPTFLEQLTPHIGQIANALGSGIRQHQINKQDETIIAALNDPNTSPMQYITLMSKLSKPRQEAISNANRLKNQEEAHAFSTKRENRLNSEHILGRYDRAIKEINDQIKASLNPKNEPALVEEINSLKKERAANAARLRDKKDPIFKILDRLPEEGESAPNPQQSAPMQSASMQQPQQMNQGARPAPGFADLIQAFLNRQQPQALSQQLLQEASPQTAQPAPQMQAPIVPQGQPQQQPARSQSVGSKERFDISNPKHKAIRDAILRETKGDRKKAEALLLEKFE